MDEQMAARTEPPKYGGSSKRTSDGLKPKTVGPRVAGIKVLVTAYRGLAERTQRVVASDDRPSSPPKFAVSNPRNLEVGRPTFGTRRTRG